MLLSAAALGKEEGMARVPNTEIGEGVKRKSGEGKLIAILYRRARLSLGARRWKWRQRWREASAPSQRQRWWSRGLFGYPHRFSPAAISVPQKACFSLELCLLSELSWHHLLSALHSSPSLHSSLSLFLLTFFLPQFPSLTSLRLQVSAQPCKEFPYQWSPENSPRRTWEMTSLLMNESERVLLFLVAWNVTNKVVISYVLQLMSASLRLRLKKCWCHYYHT